MTWTRWPDRVIYCIYTFEHIIYICIFVSWVLGGKVTLAQGIPGMSASLRVPKEVCSRKDLTFLRRQPLCVTQQFVSRSVSPCLPLQLIFPGTLPSVSHTSFAPSGIVLSEFTVVCSGRNSQCPPKLGWLMAEVEQGCLDCSATSLCGMAVFEIVREKFIDHRSRMA